MATFLVGMQGMEKSSIETSLLGRLETWPSWPIWIGNWDRTPRTIEASVGDGMVPSQQGSEHRGIDRVGIKTRLIDMLQVQCLWENVVLLVWGQERIVGYDLSASNNYVIPSQGKSIVEAGLGIALPPSVYVKITPRLGLTIINLIDVGSGVINLVYWNEIKVVLVNHSAEDFSMKAGDWIP